MERDTPDTDDPSVKTIGIFQKNKDADVTTVTELMDRIERTALERYFAARACRLQSYASKQPPSTS